MMLRGGGRGEVNAEDEDCGVDSSVGVCTAMRWRCDARRNVGNCVCAGKRTRATHSGSTGWGKGGGTKPELDLTWPGLTRKESRAGAGRAMQAQLGLLVFARREVRGFSTVCRWRLARANYVLTTEAVRM